MRIFSVLSSGKLIRASLQLSETDEEEVSRASVAVLFTFCNLSNIKF